MRIANECKESYQKIEFRNLKAGDVFICNNSTRMKLDRVIQHVHVHIGTDRADVAIEILDYDSVCLSDGTLCKHEPDTKVYYQLNAAVYLKG